MKGRGHTDDELLDSGFESSSATLVPAEFWCVYFDVGALGAEN